MLRAALALLAACLALPAAQAEAGGRWVWPLPRHQLAAGYSFDARTPYAAGMRRAVRIGGGGAVRAPCRGRVRFAGRLPRSGLGVTIDCGGLRAALVGMDAIGVQRGMPVAAGAKVGAVDAGSVLSLSARVAAVRHGYRDPLELLAPGAGTPPPLASPWAPAARRRPRGTPPRPAAPTPATAPRSSPVHASPIAWLGLALLGAGLGSGVTLHARLARRAAAVGAPSLASGVSSRPTS